MGPTKCSSLHVLIATDAQVSRDARLDRALQCFELQQYPVTAGLKRLPIRLHRGIFQTLTLRAFASAKLRQNSCHIQDESSCPWHCGSEGNKRTTKF
eukprot:3911654-Amphidinium_carterae.1